MLDLGLFCGIKRGMKRRAVLHQPIAELSAALDMPADKRARRRNVASSTGSRRSRMRDYMDAIIAPLPRYKKRRPSSKRLHTRIPSSP